MVKDNLFFRMFPPPRFLEMPAAGLDISDRSVHFVEIKRVKGGFAFKRFGERRIPSGVIDSGEIKDEEKLIQVLRALKEHMGTEFVNVSLPEQRAYLLKLGIPNVAEKEIRSVIELRLEDNVPLSPAESVFDYDIIGVNKEDDLMEISLSVMPLKVVERYTNVIKNAGLVPLSFEIEAQAIARCVVPYGEEETVMIVDFGKTRTGISIVSNGITRFTSTVDIGGIAITNVIKKTLDVDERRAEAIKRKYGIAGQKKNSEVFLAIMSFIGVLRDEANKHYTYWNTHKDSSGKKRPKIERVILCGGDANLRGLPDYLSEGLQVPVELANTVVNMNSLEEYIPPMNFSDSLRFTTAIGLAFREVFVK